MAQVIIVLAALLLIAAMAALAKPRPLPAEEPAQDVPAAGEADSRVRRMALRSRMRGQISLKAEKRLLRKLSRITAQPATLPAAALVAEHCRELAALCLDVQQSLRGRMRLPGDQHGEARMMRLCMTLLEDEDCVTLPRLLQGVQTWQRAAGTSLRERTLAPLCMKLTLTRLLARTLDDLQRDMADQQLGRRVAEKLKHTRHAEKLLRSVRHSPACVHALLTALADSRQGDLIGSVETLLEDAGSSPAQAEGLFTRRQDVLAQRVSSILDTWRETSKADWTDLAEPDDPLHTLYMQDPGGVYPRMDAKSRSMYREETARLARRFAVEESRLAHACLHLCQHAPADGLRDHVGYYLLEHDGKHALRRHLHTPRGMLANFAEQHAAWIYRIALSFAAAALGLSFLNRGHPLWMLPFFLGVASTLTHAAAGHILRRFCHAAPLPRLHIPAITDNERTLIVIPAVLRDPSHAVQMVRQLLLARESCAEGAIDCLLLADYPDNPTMTSTLDRAIIATADEAVRAISTPDRIFYYMQRQRTWDATRGAFVGRGHRRGALESLNRLICEGACDDSFDHVTVDPPSLYRRYAFVLTLDGDARLAPDSLPVLVGALSHPLNQRRDTPRGMRGYGILQPQMAVDPARARTWIALLADRSRETNPWQTLGGRGNFEGKGLYRPDALLAGTQGMLPADAMLSDELLTGELSGCTQIAAEPLYDGCPATVSGWLRRLYRRTGEDARRLLWLLPWVTTPGGVQRNPLPSHSRAKIRDVLRRALVPLCQLALILYGALARNELLTLLGACLPGLPDLLTGKAGVLRFGAELCLLPYRCLVHTDAMLRALWRMITGKRRRADWIVSDALQPGGSDTAEIFCQSIAALTLLGVSLVPWSPCIAGCLIAAVWSCFLPMMHKLDAQISPHAPLTEESAASLTDAARATWRFFQDTVSESTHHLPPDHLQEEPPRGTADHTSPGSIGMYVLACIAAAELGIISISEAAARISRTADTLEQLPSWQGLPYSRYSLTTLDAAETHFIATEDCGFYCACLLCAAQAFRAHLAEIASDYQALPERLDALADAISLRPLYDDTAQLFAAGIELPQGTRSAGHHTLLASESLLTSFVAMMRREIPRRHFDRLDRTLVQTRTGRALISHDGGMSAYLAAPLLLPPTPRTLLHDTIRTVIGMQKRFAPLGVFGVSESSWWSFDAQMNYRRRAFGLPELALNNQRSHAVIAPYASALCLPFDLIDAADNLSRLRALSMFGRYGFFESLDASPEHLPEGMDRALVRSYTALHQGMILCSICNALTGALPHQFAMLPGAEAWLLLLRATSATAPVLPADLLHPAEETSAAPAFSRSAEPLMFPVDAHVLAGCGTTLAVSAQGKGFLSSQGMLLTRFSGDCTQVEGIQFYVIDGDRIFQPTDPTLPGETVFREGSVLFRRVCGDIEAVLTAMVDPLTGDCVHAMTLTNRTQRELMIEAASFLQPAADGMSSRPQPGELHLTMHGEQPLILAHTVSCDGGLIHLTAQSDRRAFQGRNCRLVSPASLRQPMRDGWIGTGASCLSLRAKVHIEARESVQLCFRTRRIGHAPYAQQVASPDRVAELARLHSRMLTDSLSIPQHVCASLTRAFGALLWRGQPHQGAVQPLTAPLSALLEAGIDPSIPIVLIYAATELCAAILQEAMQAVGWLRRMGAPVRLCVLAQGSDAASALQTAQSLADASSLRHEIVLLRASELPEGVRETLGAAARLVLFEDTDLVTQLHALSLPAPVRSTESLPTVPLPEEDLLFDNGYGGFQPQTGDYVIHLQGNATPAPWANPLAGDHFATLATADGLAPRADSVRPMPSEFLLLQEDDRIVSATPLPLAARTNFRVLMGAGVITWHSAYADLDVTFTAATMADHAAGIRTLRLRNTGHRARTLILSYCAQFSADDDLAHLTSLADGVTAAYPASAAFDWLCTADGTAEVHIVSPGVLWGLWGDTPSPMAESHGGGGTVAILRHTLTLNGQEAASLTWAKGRSESADEIERTLAHIRRRGASALIRTARQRWTQRLSLLTVSTPEAPLNLLMNRILPYQARVGSGGVSAMLRHTEPLVARAAILAAPADDPRLLPLLTAWYIRRTGDRDILRQPIGDSSLYDHCMELLTSVTLGVHGLIEADGEEHVWTNLVYAAALHGFADCAPEEHRTDMLDMAARICTAVETAAWQGAWYRRTPLDNTIDLRCQSWAALTGLDGSRVREAIAQAWQQLYDPVRGVMTLAPGAAQDTSTAAWMLWALVEVGMTAEAWTLLRALNPIHHSLTRSAADAFRAEPYALSSRMEVNGLGTGSFDADCAAWLYTIALEKLLGFEQRGARVRFVPCVPPEWENFSLSLTVGASTWRFELSRSTDANTCDGEPLPDEWIALTDDERIHQVRLRLGGI